MASILRRMLIRRFKYMPIRDNKEKLCEKVAAVMSVPPVHPSQVIKGRDYVRFGGIICSPSVKTMETVGYSILEKLKEFVFGNGGGGGKENIKSEMAKERDEEIRRLQEEREQDKRHRIESESVWKAIQDQRNRNNKEGDDTKPENDESK